MSAAYKCDWCGDFFEQGFKGGWKKSVMKGNRQFDVSLKVSKKPHLCKKCWPKFLKLLLDELRETYT